MPATENAEAIAPTELTLVHSTATGGFQPREEEPVPVDIESSFSAWLCVLGAFFFLVPSFGLMVSVGTIQTYLHENQLNNYSAGEVGWITGMFLFLGLFFNLQIGPLMDHYGPRILSIFGAAITITMFLLMAECKTYWQFMLCFGIFGGFGSAITGLIAVSVVGKLFVRRRGLAMGLALAGASVGSVIFPVLMRETLPKMGWRWTMRIEAFTIAGMMVPGIFCFMPYPRLLKLVSPGGQIPKRKGGATLNLAAFKVPAFSFVVTGVWMFEFVIMGIGGLLPTIAIRAGFTAEDGFILLAVLGACAVPGRIFPGMLGDKLGHFNVLLLMTLISIVFMATMFVPFTTNGKMLYAFSGLWGFCSGSFLSITPVCMGKTCDAKDYGRFYGTMNFVISFAVLLCIPISGIMFDNMGPQALAGLFIAIVALGGGCFVAARALLIGQWFAFKTVI